jgi:biopolymer transport protein ExbD
MQAPPPPTSVTINLASMVDVTMCLMIFFMLTTEMVKNENSAIDLPLAVSAKSVEKKDLGDRFVINIRDASLTGGTGATYVVQEKETTLAGLLERLQSERAKRAEVNCVIRADRDLPYRYVQAVMLGCAKAGIQKVTFSAVPRAGGPQ